MRPSQSPKSPRPRHDGWTAERQHAFLSILVRTRSVSRAARAVGMSRQSAYRLRRRDPDGLFALSWARAFPPKVATPTRAQVDEGHRRAIALACLPESAVTRALRAALSKS
jgi:hypothetical protein